MYFLGFLSERLYRTPHGSMLSLVSFQISSVVWRVPGEKSLTAGRHLLHDCGIWPLVAVNINETSLMAANNLFQLLAITMMSAFVGGGSSAYQSFHSAALIIASHRVVLRAQKQHCLPSFALWRASSAFGGD